MSSPKGKWVSRRAVFAASGGALAVGPAAQAASNGGPVRPVQAIDALARGAEIQIRPSGAGAVPRSLVSVVNDWSNSVLSYGAVGDAATDDTPAFQRAFAAYAGKQIFVPPGRIYRLGAVGGLEAAGAGIIGVAGYDTVIKPVRGFTRSIFFNPNAGARSSAFGLIRDLRFDLEGESCTAIDLSHCDTFAVERVNGSGGGSLAAAAGTLVKFGAPSDRSSYNNVVRDCVGKYFSRAVVFGPNANQNRVEGGSYTLNDIAIDCAPGGVLLRPQLLGVRIEGNNMGIKEGAQGGVYLGYFENNDDGDFNFTADSDGCVILPGTTTAVTVTPLTNRANATNFRSLSFDMGYYDSADSRSNPAYERRRQIRSRPGRAMDPTFPDIDFTDLHMAPLLLANNVPLEGVNSTNENSVIIAQVNSTNEVVLSGFNRGTAAYGVVNIGNGASVRPIGSDVTDLGSSTRQWKDVHLGGTLVINGVSVVGPQGAAIAGLTTTANSGVLPAADGSVAIADAASPTNSELLEYCVELEAKLEALLARVRAHGLIAT